MKSCIISTVVMLVFSLISCGYDYDFVTEYGLYVFDETGRGSKAEIDCNTHATLEVYGRGHHAIRGTELHLLLDRSEMVSPDHVGEYEDTSIPQIRLIWLRGNLYQSAFAHELAHEVLIKVYNIDDHRHTHDAWWGPGGLVDKAVLRAAHECVYH